MMRDREKAELQNDLTAYARAINELDRNEDECHD